MNETQPTPDVESLLALQRYIQSGPFLTGVIHDLNNCLGAVIAYSELLGMGSNSPEEIESMLDDIGSAARRAAGLNDALGLLVRKESLRRVAVSIPKLIEQVRSVCEYRFRILHIQLDVQIEGQLEVTPSCYENELARAVMYLLVNALENVMDEPVKEVLLAVEVSEEAVTIRVHDRGPAMTPGGFEQALEPFHGTKGAPHLGLGLTAVKSVAELHGGSLSCDENRGISLTIPSAPPG